MTGTVRRTIVDAAKLLAEFLAQLLDFLNQAAHSKRRRILRSWHGRFDETSLEQANDRINNTNDEEAAKDLRISADARQLFFVGIAPSCATR